MKIQWKLIVVAGLIIFCGVQAGPRGQGLRNSPELEDSARNSPGSRPSQAIGPASSRTASVTPLFQPDSAKSSDPVERALAGSKVLQEKNVMTQAGLWRRTRLIQSSIQPRALRAEEQWEADATTGQLNCRRRDLFLADQLIIRVRPGVDARLLQEKLALLNIRLDESIAENTWTVRLADADLESASHGMEALSTIRELVEHSEPDGVGFGGGIPNDSQFGDQWGFNNTGQSGGTVNADVDAPEFWDLIESAPGIVIAVLDSGLNFTHPDLQGIAWQNPGEVPGDGLDNDGSGKIDDVSGWDFVNNDNDPTDDHGHGSNVSGIITANRNNGQGIAGMIGGVRILPCKILNASNSGLTSHLIAAVTYARQRGAPIMNLSLQNYPFSSTLNSEVSACEAAGILLSICAGNQGVNNDITPNYPSCYLQTNIIAVGNHDRTDARWSGSFNPSNYGPTNVDVFAPGRDILSPVLGTSYQFYTGTSQAAPFVTAVAAALKYLNPSWKASDIKRSILASAVARPAYAGLCTSGGRLNAVAAVGHATRQDLAGDRDGDGFSNLFEYLAGTRMDSAAIFPQVSHPVVAGVLRTEIARKIRPDAQFVAETSEDLIHWGTTNFQDFSSTNRFSVGINFADRPHLFLRVMARPTP